ncbi:CAP domain-containing protein [Paenirhodobacter sp.]|uniref:CAP domain-containing protein n=1 Tax=Paenirhodobacter sp. TaxID=1965326 RepID=UPI003B3E96CC
MNSVKALVLLATLGLAACADKGPQLGPDGKPLPVLYRITKTESAAIPGRVLANVNELRAKRGTAPVAMNAALSEAAMRHSKDMAEQNRPWHWGSDGSSPVDRTRRAGFYGTFVGENISETYENDVETLSAWMSLADTRDVILNPVATQIGFGWYQEASGKVWWTMVTGHE